jgi:hypothetical protein
VAIDRSGARTPLWSAVAYPQRSLRVSCVQHANVAACRLYGMGTHCDRSRRYVWLLKNGGALQHPRVLNCLETPKDYTPDWRKTRSARWQSRAQRPTSAFLATTLGAPGHHSRRRGLQRLRRNLRRVFEASERPLFCAARTHDRGILLLSGNGLAIVLLSATLALSHECCGRGTPSITKTWRPTARCQSRFSGR